MSGLSPIATNGGHSGRFGSRPIADFLDTHQLTQSCEGFYRPLQWIPIAPSISVGRPEDEHQHGTHVRLRSDRKPLDPSRPLWRLLRGFCSRLRAESGGFETDGPDEDIEIVDDALVKTVELRSPLGFEPSVWLDRAEKACREWRIDPFEELEEDKAD
jgi:hypothetical protein